MKDKNNYNFQHSEDYRNCLICGGASKRIRREVKFIKNFSDNENYEIIKETFSCLNPKCRKTWVVNVFGSPLKDYR